MDSAGQAETQTRAGATQGYDIQELKKLHAKAKAVRSRFEAEWYVNLAFFLGQQWLFWNRGRLDMPRVAEWRRMPVDNRIMPIVTSRAARKVKNRPAFVVTPFTADEDDIDSAKVGEKVLDADWINLNLSDRLFNAQLLCEIMGAGYWKVYWDRSLGESVDVLYQNGQPARTEDGGPIKAEVAQRVFPEGIPEGHSIQPLGSGDVCVELLSPLEIYPDPLATTMDDLEWLIEEKVRSPEYVLKRFGKQMEPDAAAPVGPVESRMFGSQGGTSSEDYKGVKVYELWARPSTEYPKGKRCVWAREEILDEDDEPADPMPYVMFSGIKSPGRFWPSAMTSHLRGPQVELNKLQAQIMENAARLGNPALMKSRQANVHYSGKPGEEILFDSTVPDAVPMYLQPPEVPQYVREQIDRCVVSLTEISGLHEVSNATVPTGVTAASAINLLQEADDTRIGPEIADMEERIAEAGTKVLKLRAEFNTDERLIRIAGEDGNWDIQSFRGSMLKGEHGDNTQVEVQAGSALPRSKAAKQAAMLEILTLAFQYGLEFDPRDLRRFFRDYEVAALDRLFGGLSNDEAQANRENRMMSSNQAVMINEWDDHDMHIAVHNDFRKTARFMRLDPAIAHVFDLHIRAHQEFLVQKVHSQMEAQSQEGADQAEQQFQADMAQKTTPAGGLNNPSGKPTKTGG